MESSLNSATGKLWVLLRKEQKAKELFFCDIIVTEQMLL